MIKQHLRSINPDLHKRWVDARTNAMRHMEMVLDRYVQRDNERRPGAFPRFYFDDLSPIRMVGGCVRDLIRGETPKDFDFCTPLTPTEVMAAFMQVKRSHAEGYSPWKVEIIPTGLQHGTITIRYPDTDEQFEITTLRSDVATDGRHAEVEYVQDYKIDAERRDFTMNAMSIDSGGILFDYFGGLEDARAGVVRFVGEPEGRIWEDYLRILRFFRFSARFGKLTLDTATARALRRNMVYLAQISGERIWAELSKILVMPDADVVLQQMVSEDFFQAALGVKTGTRSLNRDADAFASLRDRPEVPAVAYLFRWLLNSASEMSVFPLAVADRLRNRLKFSREEADVFRILCCDLQNAFPNLMYAVMVGRISLEHARLITVVNAEHQIPLDWVSPEFPVRGQDLLDRGWPEGRAMGDALKLMRDKWARLYSEERVELSKDDLIKFVTSYEVIRP